MKGIENIYFPISALMISVLILIMFFRKERVKNIETSIYKFLVITNFFEVVLACMIIIFALFNGSTFLLSILDKIDYIFILTWVWLLFCYIYMISGGNKKIIGWTFYINLIIYVLIFITDITIVNENGVMNSYGPSNDVLFGSILIYIIFIIIYVVKGLTRKVNKGKYVPIVVLISLIIVMIFIRIFKPELVLLSFIISYINFIMYHTIENPDVKMIEQLNIAKAAAEKANRAKSDFLSSMSHEIRTPLNAIVGFSEMIENENTIEGCKENAKDIVLASHTLLEIVNGILDISKIEANKMEIVNKEYSLLPELNNLTKLLIPRIGEKPIELKAQFAEDLPAVMYGDIGKIKQVITNILTNAAKYTEKGEINFTVNCINENDTCSLVISVEDTGRGIHPDKINTLFTKFNRLDEDKNTTIEGTGLGLAITKQLTEMMGGKIIVQSVYGKGSKFTIYLKQKIVQKEGTIEGIEEVKEDIKFDGFKILVVDDNKLNLKVADKLLKTYALSTVLVESGMECIDLIKKGEKFDLILMDDMMPRMRGPEVLARLKEIEGFSIPVIALTANATAGIREGYIKEGFDDYLAKPIEKMELTKLLKKYLSNNTSNTKVESQTNINDLSDVDILVVDDNKLNVKIARTVMKDYDFDIDEAYSGKECIEKVQTKDYDIVFMDYMMPEMDGIETLHHIKELPSIKSAVVALTADATDGSREKFLEAGFDEYVSKPINKEALNQVIKKMLNKQGNNVENADNKVEVLEKNEDKIVDKVDYLKQNGVDVDHGLELLGDMEMYDETLKLFMEGLNDRFNKMKSFKEQNDMPNYAVEVHALKSDCKYLGFMKLADMAYEHEMKSKANDSEFVNNNYNELVSETFKIFNIVKKYFN